MRSTRRAVLLGGLGASAAAAVPVWTHVHAGAAAEGSAVDSAFFGLHDATGLSRARLAPGAIRLWDVGVTWAELETTEGRPDFSRLHALLSAFGVDGPSAPQVTYVFGRTPPFASTVPDRARRTPADPPRLDRLDAFVRRLVGTLETSHPGRVRCYQVWNEPSDPLFFGGTPAQMVAMTRTISVAVKAVAPHATVVAPSVPARLPSERAWLARYLAATAAGGHPWAWFDRVGFSMYPPAGDGPEAMLGLLGSMRAVMDAAGVPPGKQVPHASEVNYDVPGPATLATDDDQVAATMRTYLVGAIAGFERVHWYRYDWGLHDDGSHWASTYWTDPHDFARVTPAGLAFRRVRSWMSGTFEGYGLSSAGTYSAGFGGRTVHWNPTTSGAAVGPFPGRTVTRHDGSRFVADGRPIPVSPYPIMVG